VDGSSLTEAGELSPGPTAGPLTAKQPKRPQPLWQRRWRSVARVEDVKRGRKRLPWRTLAAPSRPSRPSRRTREPRPSWTREGSRARTVG